MLIHNSETRRKEQFHPRDEGKVALYVCGITAYDVCHIGHARAAVVFDVLVRYLRAKGYKVTFVRNFTDVDDKIINRAAEENRSSEEVAEDYMRAFSRDMDKLGVLRADFEPCATEYIPQMQDLIQKLLDTGHAYSTSGGNVYFRVRSFPDYGHLSGRDVEELKAGTRIDPSEEKEDPLDFALWKQAKAKEPSWPSPWGPGRPGWHIECSAMSQNILGLPFDIHGGGQDLIFPHHENERAQSMAASGGPFVNYWMHNGYVQVESEKMSKSLGNFVTVQDVFQRHLPEVLRFFLLGKHYRSPLDFTWPAMRDAEKSLKRIYQARSNLHLAVEESKGKDTPLPDELYEEARQLMSESRGNLDDDLNTAACIGSVFSLIRVSNRILENKGWRNSQHGAGLLREIQEHIRSVGLILGVFHNDPQSFLDELRRFKAEQMGLDLEKVESLVRERGEARQSKDFSRADALRDQLAEMGVTLQDGPQGTVWDVE
ncbi:MAG: cysteine--tRNA ligase [Desulfohalobiaceae bacterium]|nr:cysteine--tRNA ligase [Desulfohalobiaceae bacterium]